MKLTTKINLIVAAALLALMAVWGYIDNRIEVRHALTLTARNASLLTDTIAQDLDRYMKPCDMQGVRAQLRGIVEKNSDIAALRLIGADGRVAASTDTGEQGEKFSTARQSCQACHFSKAPARRIPRDRIGKIVSRDRGGRVMRVVTPIPNRAACAGAGCHASADAQSLIGFVEADFDFAPVQADINRRGAQTLAAGAVTVLAVTAIIAAFMWFAVGRPLGALVKNMKRIAAGRHNLQLAVRSNDEIGEVARTFNTMAARLDEKEDSLKKTRDYLLGIVENSSDIIITVGPYERIETFNRGAERILGYSRREAVGRDWKTLFLNEDQLRAFSAEADSQPRVEGFEAALRHKSGDSVTVLLTESRLWGNGGKTIGKILIAVDITKYKEVQKQLIQHERLAALGTAVAKIHHSSKNILNAFKGGSYMVNTALKKGDGALLKEGWEIIESAIARISSVTQDMLDFSRAGGLNIQPGALAPLAQEVIWSVKGAAREHNVTIVSQFPDSIPAVAFDHKVIHTALMNLITNAMDACRFKDYPPGHGGEIVVRLRESADRRFVRLEVQDNGGGVETKDLERIFTPFFSTKYSEGNGLGLPITLKAARDHGGDLEVQSIEGQGSTFTLSLPVCNGACAESKHSPGRTAGSAL